MNPSPSTLRRLATIAALIRDARLEMVKRCAHAQGQTSQRLEDLQKKGPAEDMDPIAMNSVRLNYEAWADARRRDLLITLARQRAELGEAEAAAREAFGRAEALRKIGARADRRR